MVDKTYVSAENSTLYNCWSSGYKTISQANQVLNILNSESASFDAKPYKNELKAILAYTYYNIAMLWGNIIIIKPGDDVMSMNFSQSSSSTVYQYCQELMENLNSFKDGEGLVSTDFVKVLRAEVELTLGNKSTAKSSLESVNDSYVFSFGSTPIYNSEYINLLKEEATGKDNSAVWLNRGAVYGTWAALKRLGKATSLLGINDYELLMPIPMQELMVNPSIIQNPGY